MRRVKPARSLRGARLLLLRRRAQKYLPRRPARLVGGIAVVILGIAGALGAADLFDHGSRLETAVLATTATVGLSVQDIEVDGRQTTPADDVLKAIDAARGQPILAISPERARQRLEALPWVRSAIVERRLPDAIFVHLTERQPMALWQHGGKMVLIDTEGVVVTTENLGRYSSLLLVVGDDAPKHTQELIHILGMQPALMKRVTSAVRVGERRWNLQLDNGIAVEMPETGLADAWTHLAEIEKSHALLARDVVKVDLRLSDRVVVKEAPEPVKPAGAPPKAAKSSTKPT